MKRCEKLCVLSLTTERLEREVLTQFYEIASCLAMTGHIIKLATDFTNNISAQIISNPRHQRSIVLKLTIFRSPCKGNYITYVAHAGYK